MASQDPSNRTMQTPALEDTHTQTSSPPKEYPNPTTTEQVRSHIAWVLTTCTHSINDRTFTSSAPKSWSYIAEDFNMIVSTGARPSSSTKAELIENFKKVCVEYPDYQLDVPRCVTDVDMEQGVGRTFLYAAATGGPDVSVLTRKHISLFTFARDEDGRWIATGESTMFGKELWRCSLRFTHM